MLRSIISCKLWCLLFKCTFPAKLPMHRFTDIFFCTFSPYCLEMFVNSIHGRPKIALEWDKLFIFCIFYETTNISNLNKDLSQLRSWYAILKWVFEIPRELIHMYVLCENYALWFCKILLQYSIIKGKTKTTQQLPEGDNRLIVLNKSCFCDNYS